MLAAYFSRVPDQYGVPNTGPYPLPGNIDLDSSADTALFFNGQEPGLILAFDFTIQRDCRFFHPLKSDGRN
ncbi:hypothetical protein D3C85_1681850 [compost metagenome]